MRQALRQHWPEYLIEAAGLGAFMLSASVFAVLVFHPAGALGGVALSPLARRAVMGVAMYTATVMIERSMTGWAQRSQMATA